ncbi:MAG: TIGR00730 family Rossman fold protein [Proteobacteria bacterium]|nr:TIGR00730 family Rossman fold protein [Pseudomonadota bacterium]
MKRVCVFCGSSTGRRPEYADAARALADALVERGLGLVYGGADVGLMGVLADRVLGGGGEVIGVIPLGLADRELAHAGCTELHVVDSMHERKALMASHSDAFVALPGGIGTLEELCEILTWSQLGVHQKPVAVLDVADYWSPLTRFLDRSVGEGFMLPENRARLLHATDPHALLDQLAAFHPPAREGGLSTSET